MNVPRPNAVADAKACRHARGAFGWSAAMEDSFNIIVPQKAINFFWLPQGMACRDLVRRHQAALGKQRLEPGKPDFEIALVQVIRGRPVLACEAPHVDVPFAGPSCRHGQRENAALPFSVKSRLVRFPHDWTKSMTSAHVMHAIHRGFSGSVGRPVPIMQSRVTIDARRSSLHPSVPGGRIGRTRYRSSAVESHTRISVSGGSST